VRNAWATFTKMCDDAANAKRRDLRVRSDNPAAGVRAPDRGSRKLKQYLFPNELLRFIACEDVPLAWRRNLVVAVYLYMRDGDPAPRGPHDDRDHDGLHPRGGELRGRGVRLAAPKSATRQ
jgi:hypothetical protein